MKPSNAVIRAIGSGSPALSVSLASPSMNEMQPTATQLEVNQQFPARVGWGISPPKMSETKMVQLGEASKSALHPLRVTISLMVKACIFLQARQCG